MSVSSPLSGAPVLFPADYSEARQRFLTLAQHGGARVAHYPISARGPAEEELAIDTAYFGAVRPRRLFILCSGTHGIEGFAGSALQQQWLERFAAARLPAHAGCLLIHALNPYGFAWLRRTNENNVDLNRNALERFPGPPNPAYRRLDAWLNPPSAPKSPELFLLHGTALAVRHGFASLQQAIVQGQYEFPRGLFYGGDRLQESIKILRNVLADGSWDDVERVVMIDLHTGIGRFATYKLMVDVAPDSEPYREMTKWFGSEALASNRPADSIAYRVSGGLNDQVTRLFAPRPVYAAVLEFGAAPPVRTLAALRRENRAHHYASATGRVLQRAREELRAVFCPGASEWRTQVLADGARVLAQAERACFDSK